jgi:hypothetical protein
MSEAISNELLIGIGGLVLSVLTYFAGVSRTKRQLATQDRETRISAVLNAYMDFRRKNKTDGLDGLQKAGIATLISNTEIHELLSRIVAHGEHHPLGRDHATTFSGVDLPRFFQYAAQNRINFFQTSIEQVVKDSDSRA